MTGLLTLSNAGFRLVLAPAVGGAVAAFDDGGGRPILRRAPAGLASPLDAASFPLVPYCNRIRDGRFSFGGRSVALAPNMAGDLSPLHGQGWLAAWDVESAGADHARLVYDHAPGEWPWRYRAAQDVRLLADGLEIVLACTNGDDRPMPCGLGQHPYFPCGPATRIDTEVATAWTIDAHVLPVARVPATGRYDLRDRPVCGQGLDNGFSGWGGTARIIEPGRPTIVMSAPDAGFFQLYSPADGGLFVAEPVSHANAALNAPEAEWPALGLRSLAPGETMRLAMRLTLAA